MNKIIQYLKKHILLSSILFVFILLISIVTATYAYFSVNMSDNSTITGDASSTDLSLTVTRVIPTTANEDSLKMVPLLDNALSNAINGVGGQKSCIDGNGNLSCKIYRIIVTNNSTNNVKVRGTVNLQSSGTSTFSNLSWTEITSPSQTKNGATINRVGESVLEESLLIQKNHSHTYYIAVWISENNNNQNTTDTGDFGGIVTFNAGGDNAGVTANFGGYEAVKN